MNEEVKVESSPSKKKVVFTKFVFLALFLGGLGLIIFFLNLNKPKILQFNDNQEATYHNVGDDIDDQSLWLYSSEAKLARQEEELQKRAEELSSLEDKLNKEIRNLETQQLLLKETVAELANRPLYSTQVQNEYAPENDFTETKEHTAQLDNASKSTTTKVKLPWLVSANANLDERLLKKNVVNESFHIPANTIAAAVIISGIDASTGIKAQAQPQPVALEIIQPGNLPGNKKLPKLKKAVLLGAAYGDISTQRVFIRLEKISLVFPNGKTIESNIEGFVIGEDGRNGVRGKLISLNGEIISKAAMSGLLSGIGKGIADASSTYTVSPLGSTSVTQGLKNVSKRSAGEGAYNAFERLAQYYIDRAELYNPFIEVGTGRVVDVFFISNTEVMEYQNIGIKN